MESSAQDSGKPEKKNDPLIWFKIIGYIYAFKGPRNALIVRLAGWSFAIGMMVHSAVYVLPFALTVMLSVEALYLKHYMAITSWLEMKQDAEHKIVSLAIGLTELRNNYIYDHPAHDHEEDDPTIGEDGEDVEGVKKPEDDDEDDGGDFEEGGGSSVQ